MRHRVLAGACALGLLVLMGATTVSAQPGTEGFQVTGGIEPVDQVDAAKSLTGGLAETDPSLLGRTSSKLINVIVKLDYDPAAVYAGGLAGFKATSPSVTGRSLDRSAAAVGKYQTYVKGFEARATRAIQAQRARSADRAVVPARVRRALDAPAGEPGRPAARDAGRRGRPARRVGGAARGPGAVRVDRSLGGVALVGRHRSRGRRRPGREPRHGCLAREPHARGQGPAGAAEAVRVPVRRLDPSERRRVPLQPQARRRYAFTDTYTASSRRCPTSTASTRRVRVRGCVRRGTPTGTGPTRSRPPPGTASRARRSSARAGAESGTRRAPG